MATSRTEIPFVLSVGLCSSFVLSLAAVLLFSCLFVHAQPLTVLHNFNCIPGDGCQPSAPPALTPNGTVYGTTFYGGNFQDCPVGCGAVFQVTPPPQSGGTWNYSTIYEFTGGSDGCCVTTGLSLDSRRRLYGVNNSLFRLAPNTSGLWTYNDLYDVTNNIYPSTPLLMDKGGAFYGVSANGGLQNCGGSCGVVVQLIPSEGGPWAENIIYQFTGGADGAFPAALAIDSSTGTLYGVASAGGIVSPNCNYTLGCGTAFRLAPSGDGKWAFSVLYSFTGVHDFNPYGSVERDAEGNLYGLASRHQFATEVFKLTPHKNDTWTDSLLHRFGGQDTPEDYCGYAPSFLTLASNGVLYGAIFGDIDLYFGALFQLTPPAGRKGAWNYLTIWDFNESGPDLNPNGVLLGADGSLYGTTNGGDSSGGTVFQLQLPSQAPWPPSDFCY